MESDKLKPSTKESDNLKPPAKEPAAPSGRKRTNNASNEKDTSNGSNKVAKTFKSPTGKTNVTGKVAWQIRGQRCSHEIYVAYLQKGVNRAAEEPYVRNLVQHLRRNPQVRQELFGIDSIVTRRGPDGNFLPRAPYARDGWNLFVARGAVVGVYEEWLENLEVRLNTPEYSGNADLFLYSPTFKVTSYGPNEQKVSQTVMLDKDVCDLVINTFDLTNPQNRINMATVPFEDFFLNRQAGIDLVNQKLSTLLGEE